jgi:hypothetical protein
MSSRSKSFVEKSAVEMDGDDFLSFDSQTSFCKTVGHNLLINAFQQSRPEGVMDFEPAIDRDASQFF